MKLTIITPTYNRIDLLPRLIDSLANQSCKDFEWLVIDDGSTDGTEAFFENVELPFECKYIKKENGGKHTALNYAHQYINGELACIVDSDDYLVTTAVETIISDWENHAVGCSDIGQLSYIKGDSSCRYKPIQFPEEYYLSDHISYRINQDVKNDCFEITRSDLFVSFRFPEYENEHHMGEAWLWVQIAKDYKTLYINKEIYKSEYLADGLTKAGRRLLLLSPRGAQEHARVMLDKRVKLFRRIKESILYTCYGFMNRETPGLLAKSCDSALLVVACYPLGVLLSFIWKKKYLR